MECLLFLRTSRNPRLHCANRFFSDKRDRVNLILTLLLNHSRNPSDTWTMGRWTLRSGVASIGVPRILQWKGSRGGRLGQGIRGTEVPQWGPGAKPR